MTPSELEAMVRNLNTRSTAIEPILPSLAAREDLANGLDGVETRLGARVEALKSQMLTLHEKAKDDYDLLAGHLAGVPTDIQRLTQQGAGMKDDIRLLTENLTLMSRDLGNRIERLAQDLGDGIERLAQKSDGSPRRRR